MSRLSKAALSVLDLVPIRANGTVAEALQQSVSLARHVEALGFERFWLAEHHNMDGIASSATPVLIGHIAGQTSRIRVGSGGVMLPNHAPLVVAENFGTLAALYPGRIDLGLGRAPGADQATMRALRRDRLSNGDDFPEQVAELRALLAPAQPGQRLVATPGAGSDIPVWLLGSSLFSAQLAAHLGLPYAFASHFAPRFLLDAIRLYRELFRPSAALDKPYVMVGAPVIAAPTDQEAAYLATSTQQKILALMRGQSLKLQPPVNDMDARWDPAEQHSVEAFLGVAVVGGPQKIAQGLDALLERTQADELMIVSDIYDPALRQRSFDIVAQVRADGR
ncbi:LLM class flavin-dependent oxidoreductase [Pandoraea terrae]|uniref:Luciferase-like monooxygenase n=1 Tax=Pandoraea terrae TaxID=1537710 RepID=A0A5E4WD03_9BURK|nr:LLM class flavin-dependent oxidoreductase [Pandoraea terrae]VVE21250.1 LLM class flavin-dependent oxidoreductase [Pandoraea terrae]